MVLVPEGRLVFPEPERAREPAARRPSTRARGRLARSARRRCYARLPAAARTRARRPRRTLSGGEQQMLAIGRGLMARPRADAARRAHARPGAGGGAADVRAGPATRGGGPHAAAGRAGRAAHARRGGAAPTWSRTAASPPKARPASSRTIRDPAGLPGTLTMALAFIRVPGMPSLALRPRRRRQRRARRSSCTASAATAATGGAQLPAFAGALLLRSLGRPRLRRQRRLRRAARLRRLRRRRAARARPLRRRAGAPASACRWAAASPCGARCCTRERVATLTLVDTHEGFEAFTPEQRRRSSTAGARRCSPARSPRDIAEPVARSLVGPKATPGAPGASCVRQHRARCTRTSYIKSLQATVAQVDLGDISRHPRAGALHRRRRRSAHAGRDASRDGGEAGRRPVSASCRTPATSATSRIRTRSMRLHWQWLTRRRGLGAALTRQRFTAACSD